MDAPTITLQILSESTNLPKESPIKKQHQDSIQSLQNSSEVSVSKVHQQHRNSLIQMGQKPNSNLDFAQKPNEAQIKAEDEDSESSSESGAEGIKEVKKSGREQKFKRSTNNSHKKFISVARRWLFKNHRGELKVAFENKFHAFRSTRTYFFIILAFIKTIMSEQKQRQFQVHFTKQVSVKILEYEKQIENTANENLRHFRSDEVTDLKFSIKASDVYFEGDLDKSIECVYKKDKTTIVKKHHYEQALKTVRGIENEFKDPNFLENTIAVFGGKKIRNKSLANQDLMLTNGKYLTAKDSKSRFFFPEMFGRNMGFICRVSQDIERQNQILPTVQPQQSQTLQAVHPSQVQSDKLGQGQKDNSSQDWNKIQSVSVENKKMLKVYIIPQIPQIIKMELQTDLNNTHEAINNWNQSINNVNSNLNFNDLKNSYDA